MEPVDHINYPDRKSDIYCRRRNALLHLDAEGKYWNGPEGCLACPLFNGDYQGLGVECLWYDNQDDYVVYVDNPVQELLRVSEDIDKGILKRDAVKELEQKGR